MNTTGRKLDASDLPEVMKLDLAYFPHPWKPQEWREMNLDHHLLLGWKERGKLVAFVLLALAPGDDVAHLLKILIAPEYRGSGLGNKIWDYLRNEISPERTSLYLEVAADNHRAIKYYEKMGLETIRRNQKYYSDGQDALIMTMAL